MEGTVANTWDSLGADLRRVVPDRRTRPSHFRELSKKSCLAALRRACVRSFHFSQSAHRVTDFNVEVGQLTEDDSEQGTRCRL